jgi:TonB family protein
VVYPADLNYDAASMKSLAVAALSLSLFSVLPSSAQVAANAPANTGSGRIQNIAPEEMWKRVTQCVLPTYPGLAFNVQITGTVDIGLGISPEGDVGNNSRVLDGPPLLVKSAMDAIRQWKFRANIVQGEVTWSRVRVLVRFYPDGTTVVDFAPAILADNFGDPGTPRSAAAAFPRPAGSPECKSVQPGTGVETREIEASEDSPGLYKNGYLAAISRVAASIAEPLQSANATKVVVADLRGPEGQTHPLGKYLADQLTLSLQKNFPNLEVIDRPQQKTNPNDQAHSGDEGRNLKEMKKWARKLGAKVVIAGSFAKVSQGIGVSLSATFCKDSQRSVGQASGLIPVTDEITALSPDPIPSFANGIARAGTGGVTTPTCAYCPDPLYSPKARDAKFQGTVVLSVVVTAEGRAEQIRVAKGPGMGLEENAIGAVKEWRFKPAVGPDGKPVAVLIPIEVTFRLR